MSATADGPVRINGWLEGRHAGWLLLVGLGAVYAWVYAHHPLNPGSAPVEARAGWWSWADQYKNTCRPITRFPTHRVT